MASFPEICNDLSLAHRCRGGPSTPTPVARAWAGASEPAGKPGPELQNPPPHRFIGNLQPSLGQELLHVPVAQGEPEIKPDRMLDDRRREAMSAVGELIHAGMLLSRATRSNPVSVTMLAAARSW